MSCDRITLSEVLDRGLSLDWSALQRNDHYSERYSDAQAWPRRAWKDAARIGLDRATGLRILDMGTGPGYFAYVCEQLGHHCTGIELPNSQFCASVHQMLGLKNIAEHRITPQSPAPDHLGEFDLITAWRAHFISFETNGACGL